MRILIAEDEAISRRMLESTLTRCGYEVVVTDNGHDALVVLQDDDYLTKPFDPDELYARVQVGMRVVQLQRSLTGRVRQLEVAEAELRNLSLTDDLTGLCNRRGFFVHAEQYPKTSRRLGKQVLLFYADMDGLKQINDTFGHEEGSQAILRLAEILKETFREADIVARLGGDEFAVLVTDVTRNNQQSISARLRNNLISPTL